MKNKKIHLIIGTVICAATMLLFLAFYNVLPEHVPIQITAGGAVGNTMPKQLFVFGMPVIFTIVNLVKNVPLAQEENAAVYRFYFIPGIALVVSAAALWMAMNLV